MKRKRMRLGNAKKASEAVATTVAMVTFNWVSAGGGVSKYVFTLTDRLQTREDLRVIAIAADPLAGEGGIAVTGAGVHLAWRTLKALRRIRPQVIHCHGHIWMGAASAFYKWLSRRPCVLIYSMHTKLELPGAESARSWTRRLAARARLAARRALHGAIIRQSDTVTAVSQAMANDLTAIERVRPRATIEIIPPGVEIREPDGNLTRSFLDRYGLVGKFPIIASIGVFHHEWKVEGHERLISALVILRKRYPKARLVLVGDGRLRKRIENYVAAAGAGDEVILTGYLASPELALSAADVYGHLALNDAAPIAILEAMLLGKAIVAANVGGIPEMIEHQKTGLLVDPRPEPVAEAISWLLENEERRKSLGEGARRAASTSYTWESVANRFERLYRRTPSVVGQSGG